MKVGDKHVLPDGRVGNITELLNDGQVAVVEVVKVETVYVQVPKPKPKPEPAPEATPESGAGG